MGLTAVQIQTAAKNAGFPEAYRTAFEAGLIHNLWFINRYLKPLNMDNLIRWLSAGIYQGVTYVYPDEQLYPTLEKFLFELFTTDADQKICAQALEKLRTLVSKN